MELKAHNEHMQSDKVPATKWFELTATGREQPLIDIFWTTALGKYGEPSLLPE